MAFNNPENIKAEAERKQRLAQEPPAPVAPKPVEVVEPAAPVDSNRDRPLYDEGLGGVSRTYESDRPR